jgi:hypothetical protein
MGFEGWLVIFLNLHSVNLLLPWDWANMQGPDFLSRYYLRGIGLRQRTSLLEQSADLLIAGS